MTVLENLEMGSYRADARRRRAEGLDVVLGLCDRGYVLETGRVVLGGDRQMLLPDPRVQHAYLGA